MHWEEHLMLIAHTVHYFGDRLKVIGNTGSNNTREALKATEYGFASGMHASLQINPYYGKTSPTGLKEHFQRVLELGPAIIYNVPSRTGQDLPPELIRELAKHPNLLGVKECAGNERIAAYEKEGIACWSGNDDQAWEARHHCGGHGVISVTANVVPGLMRRLMDEPDSTLADRLKPLMNWLPAIQLSWFVLGQSFRGLFEDWIRSSECIAQLSLESGCRRRCCAILVERSYFQLIQPSHASNAWAD